MTHTIIEREIGDRTLRLETGKVAKLANAAVLATYGGTTVLATVVRSEPREGIDFFPLNVDYRERTSAAGKYPGGFRKREGAPEAFRTLEKKITRKLIVEKGAPRRRPRRPTEIRPLDMRGRRLRAHARLGAVPARRDAVARLLHARHGRDEQIVDGLLPEYSKKFYLHYNFPPFCVGEAGRIMGPGRREIGHGALAERSLLGILPTPRTSPTPSASSATSPSPTARRRWPPSAAGAWR
jgi:polyribonucleotide nucleotidyltransferase